MGSTDEVHVMFVEELCDNVSTESERDAAVVLAPAQDILVRVSPEQITQEALIGNISGAHHPPHLFHGLEVWRQSWGKKKKTMEIVLMTTDKTPCI